MIGRSTASITCLVALSLWLGAATFFSAAVAPSLFSVVPTRTVAGAVVGRLLPIVFYAGILVGALLLGVWAVAQRRWPFGGREIAAVVMLVSCTVAQLIVSPRIERLRAQIGGPLEALATNDPRRVAFGRLHGISVGWLGLAMLAALVALVIVCRAISAASDPTL